MNIEEALKDVYERRAELTPSAERVRAAVAARTPVRARPSGRRIALLAAAAALLVAVPVVVAVSLSDSGRTSQVTPATTSAEPTKSAPVMRLQSTWLPDGFVETKRGFGPQDTGMHRSWTNKTDQGSVSVAFVPGGEFSAAVNVKPIQVNGTEGQMIEFGVTTHAAITWRVSPNEMARVDIQLVPDAMAVAQRVAASIKPVEFEASLPVQFGWLPAGVKFDGGQSESTNGKDVYTSMGLSATNAPALAALTIAPRRLDEPGMPSEPVTVLGKPGSYLTSPNRIVAQINETYWLSIFVRPYPEAALSKDDLVRIVDSLKLGDLNFGWVGQRGLPIK